MPSIFVYYCPRGITPTDMLVSVTGTDIQLSPKGLQLLDAMAQAADLPNYTLAQETITIAYHVSQILPIG